MNLIDERNPTNPWPHRMAIVVACATFPLIWAGGLVTTYDAGMAVPDWPSTYGYNLFAYPFSTWFYGPFDVFVEHGHRLLGASAGLLTIGLVYVVFRFDKRRSVRLLAIGSLLAVITQGLLGGFRVLLNEVTIGKFHGIFGQTYFCLVFTLIAMTSKWWGPMRFDATPALRKFTILSCTLTLLVFVQLVLGAHVRHLPTDMLPRTFAVIAMGHIVVAAAIFTQAVFVVLHFFRNKTLRQITWVRNGVFMLVGLIVIQIMLGVSTWFVKYGWPIWLPRFVLFENYIIVEKSMVQALVVTGHVAVGALILASSWFVSLRGLRVTSSFAPEKCAGSDRGGLAKQKRFDGKTLEVVL